MGYYDDALMFVQDGKKRVIKPQDGSTHNPYQLEKLATYIIAHAYNAKGEFEKAIESLEVFANNATPSDKEELEEQAQEYLNKMNTEKVMKSFTVLSKMMLSEQQKDIIASTPKEKMEDNITYEKEPFKTLISLLPEKLHNHPRVTKLKRNLQLGRDLSSRPGKPHVAMFCSLNFEEWDPISVLANGGGGSETAVVEMAKRFADSGYEVEVYANPPEEKVIGGVSYKKAENINFSDTFDIFVSWRNPWIYNEVDIVANKKYLWLQDIMVPQDYPAHVVEQIDKIIVLSEYHRGWAPAIPDDKFFFTTNGIDVDLIEEVEKKVTGERQRNLCINASSADRGLEGLINMWKELPMKDIRNAPELRWYYGWNSWNKLRNDPESNEWKEKMNKAMKEAGVKNMGRIGKAELYKQYFLADYWVYPLVGPAETSCITAMEAQACGMYPVTTGITALEETQGYGIKIKLEVFQEALIHVLQHRPLRKTKRKGHVIMTDKEMQKRRKEMMKWAREKFNWDAIANDWMEKLFYGLNLDE
jgi:glycosyltransferase involved in cell wall biosynthesis